jgi:hypothetical protein
MAVLRSSSIAALLLLALGVLLKSETSAYPIIIDVDEGDTKVFLTHLYLSFLQFIFVWLNSSTLLSIINSIASLTVRGSAHLIFCSRYLQCFNFNVPEDDDAHMVFMVLPDEGTSSLLAHQMPAAFHITHLICASHVQLIISVDDAVEEWFNSQMHEMTSKGSAMFMKALPEVSKEIHNKIQGDEYNGRSNVYLKLTVPKRPVLRHQMFMWYAPIVVMNVVRAAQRGKKGVDEVPPSEYTCCFENKNSGDQQGVKVLFDVVLLSDEGSEDALETSIIKKEHLTPLEMNFQEGIKAANTILNEMKYMERREARMRHTAESTNAKIRFFSYVSVIVLLGVSFLQRTYLKSYFKKKKLM